MRSARCCSVSAALPGIERRLADRRDQVRRVERPVAVDHQPRHAGRDQRGVEQRPPACERPAARRGPRRCGAACRPSARPSVPNSAGRQFEAWSQIDHERRLAGAVRAREPALHPRRRARLPPVRACCMPSPSERCIVCYDFCFIAPLWMISYSFQRLCQTRFDAVHRVGGTDGISAWERHANGVAELITDRIDTMPAGERRAAQTLIANYPRDRPARRWRSSRRRPASVRRPSCASSRGWASRTIPNSRPRCRTNWRRSCSRLLPARACRSHRREGDGRRRRSRRRWRISARPSGTSRRSRSRISWRCSPSRNADVFLIGGRFTDPVARYMAAHLTIIRPRVLPPRRARRATGATG